jgi:hypothetical protein
MHGTNTFSKGDEVVEFEVSLGYKSFRWSSLSWKCSLTGSYLVITQTQQMASSQNEHLKFSPTSILFFYTTPMA